MGDTSQQIQVTKSRLSTDFVQDSLEVDALGALNRQAKGTIPDQLSKRTKATADTKGCGVVKCLLEAVVVEEDTGAGVNIREWILGLICVSLTAFRKW